MSFDLSVVILSWNTASLTLACLRSLYDEPSPEWSREIVVVDNGSTDDSCERIERDFPEVRLIRRVENAGYSVANNEGVRCARGRYVCLLNSDTRVRPGALDRLTSFLESNPDHAAAAPKLIDPDGGVQCACMRFPGLATAWCFGTPWGRFPPGSWVIDRYFMRDFDHRTSRDVDQPPGACLMMDRQEYLDRGGLDESFFLFFSDVDLCRRLHRAGRKIRYVANAEVVHHGGASTAQRDDFVVTWHRDWITYYVKQYGSVVLPYVRLCVRMRALQAWWSAGRRYDDRARIGAERAQIRCAMNEILAEGGRACPPPT